MAVYNYIQLTGTVVEDSAVILAQVESEYKSAFGADLITTPDTPQGMLITAETLGRIAVAQNNAMLANQINPNLAGGVFLAAIGALTGTQPTAESFTTVIETLNGVAGTVIPTSVILADVNGNQFSPVSIVTLDGTGTATVEVQALVGGPIDVNAGTLTSIVEGVLGLETVTNAAAGTPGQFGQSDEEFRELRRVTLAAQGTALPEAITSALRLVPGVKSLTFRENVGNTTVVIDGVTLVPHSIYVCVDGGTDLAVATTLLAKKSAGANWNGSTTVNVTEPVSGQIYPVTFDRPDEISILVRVTIKNGNSVPDPVGAVKAAILAYAAGNVNGEEGFVVGASVSPFELAGAVTCVNPTIYVQKLEVSYGPPAPLNFVVAELPIEIFQIATIDESSISVIQV